MVTPGARMIRGTPQEPFVKLKFLPQPVVAEQLAVIGRVEDDRISLQIEFAQRGENLPQRIIHLREICVVHGDSLFRLQRIAQFGRRAVESDQLANLRRHLRQIHFAPSGRKRHVLGAEHLRESPRGHERIVRLQAGANGEKRLLPAVVLQETNGFAGDEIVEVILLRNFRRAADGDRTFSGIERAGALPWVAFLTPQIVDFGHSRPGVGAA